MGIMDNMKDKMADKTNGMDMESLRARFEELRRKDEAGQADASEREEMSVIRTKIDA